MNIAMSHTQFQEIEKCHEKLREATQCLDDWIVIQYKSKDRVDGLTLLNSIKNSFISCLFELNELMENASCESMKNEVARK